MSAQPLPKPLQIIPGLDCGALKVWMWLRQDGKCVLCGEPIDLTIPRFNYGGVSTEHKRPRSKRGDGSPSNLAVSHRECNRNRRDNGFLKQIRPPQLPEYAR